MNRLSIRLVTLLLILAVATVTVWAGLHFVGSAGVSSGSIIAEIDLAGFGSRASSVTVNMSITGTGLTALCQNKGGNIATGQNPVTVSTSVSDTVRVDRNGSATANFHVSITPPPVVAGCPNGNWRVVDLLGTINIVFTATDNSNGDTSTQSLTCQVDEANHYVQCN